MTGIYIYTAPTFTIKIKHSWIRKYTKIVPMDRSVMGFGFFCHLQVVNASITACQKGAAWEQAQKKMPRKKNGIRFCGGQVRVGRGYIFQLDLV